MKKLWLAVAVAGLLGGSASADVWDIGTDPDNSPGTDNVPTHGTEQRHDLAALAGPTADQDWYAFNAPSYSSWEARLDGTTGAVALGVTVAFVDSAAAAITGARNNVNTSTNGCDGCAVSARLENSTATNVEEFVRIGDAQCGTTCNANDQYTFRYFDTTYSVPRFNNAGGQVTVLVVQNLADEAVGGTIHLMNAAGTRIGGAAFGLGAKQHFVVSTAVLAGGAGAAGVILITHNGAYGSLSGKSVVLDPATGFSFDTPLVARPN